MDSACACKMFEIYEEYDETARMADARARLVDIGMVSREIRPEEAAQGVFSAPVVKDTGGTDYNNLNNAYGMKTGFPVEGIPICTGN